MNNDEKRLRRIFGVLIYVLAGVRGWAQVFHSESDALYLAFALSFALALTYWCIIDSRILRRPILYSFYWLLFFLWPIAVPAYLVWSRKLRGLGFALLHTIGLYCVCLVVYNVAGYLAWGHAWFHHPS